MFGSLQFEIRILRIVTVDQKSVAKSLELAKWVLLVGIGDSRASAGDQ
jgi:hypothetical protein